MTRHLPFDRSQRVADEIYRIVSETLISEISDPRLSGVRLTIVRMTKDLRTARINFRMEGSSEETRREAVRGFKSASGFLKRKLGDELNLKFMPELEFFYDETIDVQDRIDELFSNLPRG